MKADVSVDLERLSREPVTVDFHGFSIPAEASLRGVLRLLDACPSAASESCARIITFDRLSALSQSDLDAVGAATAKQPVFICPGTNAPVTLDTHLIAALADVVGFEVRGFDPAPVSRYTFAETSELWPFAGMTLGETKPRTLAALDVSGGAVAPLVTAEHGGLFLKVKRGKGIYVTVVPLPEAPDDGLLKNELEPGRFMTLLPLLFFLRAALGERGWQTPALGATFMVDDPNLRLARYGFLDLSRLVDAARDHDFHTSIAMIPLDYRKTRSAAADVVRRHPDRLSLVIHGVDHVRGEFATDVPISVAQATLAQGLARMEAHEQRTGLHHARALTFPHGLCNETWMEAMRNVGLDAAIVSRSFPFRTEAQIDDPLYELYPAEMTFRGFPVVNRFQAEKPKERLLFQALVGKPLIVYTHHSFFRGGVDRVLEIADFLNRHVSPQWESVDAILRSNYQVKRLHNGTVIRTFSNRISIPAEHGPPKALLKPGRDFPLDETCLVDSTPIEQNLTTAGLIAVVPEPWAGSCDVAFGPVRPIDRVVPIRRARLTSHARRFATELRDQIVMPTVARSLDVRQRIGRSFR